MIYFFGDLRQLRKFELARPTISRPIPMPVSSPMPARQALRGQPLSIPSRSAPPLLEKTVGGVSPTAASMDSPAALVTPNRPYAHFSTSSLAETSCESCESGGSSIECNEIDVSPAYFDDVPAPEGPATASCLHRPEYRLTPSSITYVEPAHVRPSARSAGLSISTSAADNPVAVHRRQSRRSLRSSMKSPSEYGPTAGFIPSDYHSNSTTSLSDASRSLRSQRSACYFDFDTLPTNKVGQPHAHDGTSGGDSSLPPPSTSVVVVDPSSPHPSSSSPSLAGVGSLFGRAQYKCNQCPPPPVSSTNHRPKRFSLATLIPSFTAGVPAFATPLTQIQSPAVKRAQWEVVVRAGFVAAILAGGLTGIVVGVVP